MGSNVSDWTEPRSGHPVLWVFAAFPIACFTCALLTDFCYLQTANIMWADFSDWLLAVGMAGGVLAAVAGLVSWVAHRRDAGQRRNGLVALGSVLALVVALLNNFVHTRDAWTSVVPTGIALSAVTVLLMLITAWAASAGSVRRSAVRRI